jgi:hypothetical protein
METLPEFRERFFYSRQVAKHLLGLNFFYWSFEVP